MGGYSRRIGKGEDSQNEDWGQERQVGRGWGAHMPGIRDHWWLETALGRGCNSAPDLAKAVHCLWIGALSSGSWKEPAFTLLAPHCLVLIDIANLHMLTCMERGVLSTHEGCMGITANAAKPWALRPPSCLDAPALWTFIGQP